MLLLRASRVCLRCKVYEPARWQLPSAAFLKKPGKPNNRPKITAVVTPNTGGVRTVTLGRGKVASGVFLC